MTQTLPKPITEYIEASNTFDGDRLIAPFADDESSGAPMPSSAGLTRKLSATR